MIKNILVTATDAAECGKLTALQFCLVHDGKKIIVYHNNKSTTGTGNISYKMVVGTRLEIDAEIKRLGLVSIEKKPVEQLSSLEIEK